MKNFLKNFFLEILYYLIILLKFKKGTGVIEYINSDKRFNSMLWIRNRMKKQYKFVQVQRKEHKDTWGSYRYVYTLECWEPVT